MSTLLATATAVEDNVLDTMKMAEDVVVRTAHTLAEGFEPITERLPEFPMSGLVPTPAEVVDHTFDFVDRLAANLREFSTRVVALLPATVKTRPATVKSPPKAHAA